MLPRAQDSLEQGRRAGVVQSDIDPTGYTLHMTVLSLSSIATADSWSFLLNDERDKARQRHLAELTRIAKTSLFGSTPAPHAARVLAQDPQEYGREQPLKKNASKTSTTNTERTKRADHSTTVLQGEG